MSDSNKKTIVIAAMAPDSTTSLKVHALALALIKQGHTVHRATSAEEALALCLTEKPDMLIASDSLTKADPMQTERSGESLMEFAIRAREGDVLTTALGVGFIKKLQEAGGEADSIAALQTALKKTSLVLWDEACLPDEGYSADQSLHGRLRMAGVHTLYYDATLKQGHSLVENAMKTIIVLDYSGVDAQADRVRALAEAGYRIISFQEPIAAGDVLTCCDREKADMVITGDTPHKHHGMTGVDVLHTIRDEPDAPHKPECVWLTKSEEPGLERDLKEQGITVVRDEPRISTAKLLAVVSARLREQPVGRVLS
ncbi:MAG: hypothetical protein IT567_05885 [Alphaproteobacteria bacterium]|nr:hypothetical protein [Alphaproteobacteria bacterium]